jgi:hypothetical protein
LLDIEDHDNFFLGTSLYVDDPGNLFDRMSALGDYYYYTGGSEVEKVKTGHEDEIEGIEEYYSISMNN